MPRTRLRNARLEAGLTQEQLAQKLHVERKAVMGWEAGTQAPYPLQIPAIRAVLKNTDERLFENEALPVSRHKLKAARIAKGLREKRRITQQDVADEIGCSVEMCGLWERGKHFPQEHWRKALVSYFGVESASDLDLIPPETRMLDLHDIMTVLEEHDPYDVLTALQGLSIFRGVDLLAFIEEKDTRRVVSSK